MDKWDRCHGLDGVLGILATDMISEAHNLFEGVIEKITNNHVKQGITVFINEQRNGNDSYSEHVCALFTNYNINKVNVKLYDCLTNTYTTLRTVLNNSQKPPHPTYNYGGQYVLVPQTGGRRSKTRRSKSRRSKSRRSKPRA